jgi:RIO kinase 1
VTDDYTDDYYDKYAYLEEDTPGRPPRKVPHRSAPTEVAESPPTDSSLQTTYKPSRFEEEWLLSSLGPFYGQGLISDILTNVKGGKEATVYCCQAGPEVGRNLLAAKVYRPRRFRNLRNDAMYREGRAVLTADGRPVKSTDHRIMRALGKKTEFGMQVQHTSWLMYEYTTLESLYRAGAAVPQPFAAGENAILMGYEGDVHTPAPTLSQISLDKEEAEVLLAEVVRNVELLLQQGFIHGDLSAYNILYWEGKITLIDFPQVTSLQGNQNAPFILQRDLARVFAYFARQGVPCDPEAVMAKLWRRYGHEDGD